MFAIITQDYPDGYEVHYRVPRNIVGKFLWAAAFNQNRSFARDSHRAIAGIQPKIITQFPEHIPADGSFLVTCNHYNRPGFGAWWIALAISSVVGQFRSPEADPEIHWVMTAAWRYPEGSFRRQIVTPLTRWGFARAANVYRFVTMPPMPPRPDEFGARTAAVLRTLRLARKLVNSGGIIGLAPEGRDSPEKVGEPPKGVGEFITLLVKTGFPILPVGVAEHQGKFMISFGELFVPVIPSSTKERDRLVSMQVMRRIANLLP